MEALLALIVDGESLFGGKPKSMEIETPRRQKHNVITGKYYIIHVITLLKCHTLYTYYMHQHVLQYHRPL